ncbi:ankyrin [Decorospora gaudefroyi]|uniref:Ankyrin n=1 Tax=Decorospora gaudefroyi TaxID=184978 RepID=A0A6A5KUH9_9PLEO|nr:ankyrin [Decorospora gaudefroyi]
MSEQTTPMASEEMLIASFEERTSKSHDSDVQLPIRQASPKLSHNGNVVELPQPLSNDNGESGLDGNSLSESWEDIRTPDADANVTNAIESGEMARQPWELRRVWWDYEEFYDAIEHGDIAAVKAMLDDGANIERKADDGGTPLVIAIYELQWDIIRLLLERGANIHHPVIDTPPIFHAISGAENAPAIMQLLLDHGASLEVTSGPTSMNPLHWAAVKGMVHAADFIISKGFDMERRCLRGKTPLILAAERGHTTVVKLLRAKGAALHVRSNNGGTALMWATSEGHLETVKFLLEEGMNVEDRDKEGCTALSVACDHGHVDIVQVLIERGADVNTLSDEPMSRTPAMEAALSGHTEVLQALLDQGADLTMDPPGGVALLERAMKAGYLDTVKTILKHLGGPDYPTQSVALQMAMAGSHATMKSLMTTVSIMYPHIDSKSACSGDLAWIKWVLDGGGDLVRSRAMRHLLHLIPQNAHVIPDLN